LSSSHIRVKKTQVWRIQKLKAGERVPVRFLERSRIAQCYVIDSEIATKKSGQTLECGQVARSAILIK